MMQMVLGIALWSAAVVWAVLLLIVVVLRPYRQAPRTSEEEGREQATELPLVSILVPARNEEDRVLREAIGSMLAQDYPNIEIIVVNDRSTDRTQEILEELAARDSRLRVVQGQEPPPGWLGKPFALHQALAVARGEWILSIDADILLHRATVRKALALATRFRCDALSLLPRMDYVSFWDHVIEPQALNLLRLGMLVGSVKARFRWATVQPSSQPVAPKPTPGEIAFHPLYFLSAYVGDQAFTIGAFTLIRRDALDAVGGYAAIRSEVMDETILGIRLHRRGFRVFAVEGAHLIHTPARVKFSELWEAYSRVICPAVGRNPLVLGASAVAAGVLTLLPVITLGAALLLGVGRLSQPVPGILLPAAMAYLAMVAVGALLSEEDRHPSIYHIFSFVGYAVFIAIAVSSVWRRYAHRDVVWKGRPVYSGVVTEPRPTAPEQSQV